MLPRAAISSRASRLASSPASSAMAKKPMPARPDCVISTALAASLPEACQATTSSISATADAVASDIRREVSTPDISTGNTSSAAKFRLPLDTRMCSAVKATRSTPMVASHWRRRCAALSKGCGCVNAPKRGNSHSVMACTA